MPRIARLASHVAAGQVLGVALFAAFTVLSARAMTVTEFGTFSAAYAVTLVLADILDFGTGAKLILGSANLDDGSLGHHLGILRSSRTLTCGTLLLVSGVALSFVSRGYLVITMAAIVLTWLFSLRVIRQVQQRCKGHYIRSSITLVTERGATLLVAAIFPPTNPTVGLLCIAAGTLCALALSGSEFNWSVSFDDIVQAHKASRNLGVSSVASDVTTMDVPVLSLVVTSSAAGLYAVPSRLLAPLAFVGSAFGTVLMRELPYLSREAIRRSTVRWMASVGFLAVCIAAPVALAAPQIIPALLGQQYVEAVSLVRLACVTAVLQCVSIVSTAGLQALGKAPYVARISVIGAVSGLAGVAVGGVMYGPVGACIAMLLLQTIQVLAYSVGLCRSTISVEVSR